jgi:hypothetical protein
VRLQLAEPSDPGRRLDQAGGGQRNEFARGCRRRIRGGRATQSAGQAKGRQTDRKHRESSGTKPGPTRDTTTYTPRMGSNEQQQPSTPHRVIELRWLPC